MSSFRTAKQLREDAEEARKLERAREDARRQETSKPDEDYINGCVRTVINDLERLLTYYSDRETFVLIRHGQHSFVINRLMTLGYLVSSPEYKPGDQVFIRVWVPP